MGNQLAEVLEQAKKRAEDKKNDLLQTVCDLCHKPYSLMQEQLEECCECCPVMEPLKELIRLERTCATAELMKIVGEEMLPEKKAQ